MVKYLKVMHTAALICLKSLSCTMYVIRTNKYAAKKMSKSAVEQEDIVPKSGCKTGHKRQ